MAKLCSVYTGPPLKLCATQSMKANRRKKREKKATATTTTPNRRFGSGKTAPRYRKEEKKIVADAVCYGCTSSYTGISISPLVPLFILYKSVAPSLPLSRSRKFCVFFFPSRVYVCDADSSFCYFQTRISFRNTICIFEPSMPQCLNGLIKHSGMA